GDGITRSPDVSSRRDCLRDRISAVGTSRHLPIPAPDSQQERGTIEKSYIVAGPASEMRRLPGTLPGWMARVRSRFSAPGIHTLTTSNACTADSGGDYNRCLWHKYETETARPSAEVRP